MGFPPASGHLYNQILAAKMHTHTHTCATCQGRGVRHRLSYLFTATLAIFSSQCCLFICYQRVLCHGWPDRGAATSSHPQSQPSPAPPQPNLVNQAVPHAWATRRAGLCRATLCWAGPGYGWRHVLPSTAMHLQLAAPSFIDFWRRCRRRRSTNPLFGYSLDPVACSLSLLISLALPLSAPLVGSARLWLLSLILTHLATRFSSPDCNPNSSGTPFETAAPQRPPLCGCLRLYMLGGPPVKRACLETFE